MWLSSLAFTLGNISFSPNLASVTKFYGPFAWEAQSRAIKINDNIPEFLIYGVADNGSSIEPIVIKADFLEWAGAISREGQVKMGSLFATGLPLRPFVTQWDIDKDASFWINIFSSRINLKFFFWSLLASIFPIIFYFWLSTDINYVISPKERWSKDQNFKHRVKELEFDYKDNPLGLRRRTFLLALLGYSVIWGVAAIIAAIAIGLIITLNAFTQWGYYSILAGLPAFWLVIRLAKSFLTPRGRDYGLRVKRKDAPLLFNLLSKIQRRGKGPAFARVFIDEQMNASVSRHTGFLGSFGLGPVTLTLGLSLMQALTVRQLAGVIGHEYGHIAAKDNALSQWIYRIRNSWLGMGERLKLEPIWYILQLNKFYQWFISMFRAYSFTLSRQCEYEADSFSASIVNSDNIAQALIAIEIRASHIDARFWERIWKKAEDNPNPIGSPYKKISIIFKNLNQQGDNSYIINRLKEQERSLDSTHPVLKDRVAALGKEIKQPAPLKESSANKLLGSHFEQALIGVFDSLWERENLREWKGKYREHQRGLEILGKFSNRDLSTLKREDLLDILSAAYSINEDNKVMDICWEFLKRNPEDSWAEVNLLGYQLTIKNDESALVKLDELVNIYPRHLAKACKFAIKYLEKKQRYEEVEIYKFRLKDWGYKNSSAQEERKHIYSTDVFSYHGIMLESVKGIRKILKEHKKIKTAWLVRKEVDYFKEDISFIMIFEQALFNFSDRQRIAQEVKDSLDKAALPSFFSYFWIEDVKGLQSKLKKDENFLIYKK